MTALSVSHTSRAATGHWPVLLPALGIHITAGGRAQPCPVCGGKDRFRFDNLQGRGTWFCNQCGGGDGLNLVEKALAVTAKEAAVKVAGVLGEPSGNTLPEYNPQQEQQDKAQAQHHAAQQARLLLASARQQAGNAYLTAKGWPDTDTLTLQGPSLRVGGITYQPGDLLVPLTDSAGEVVNVQLINAAGVKRTLAGGQTKHTCHFLPGQDNAVIWLTEGYATGLTVHHLTGKASVSHSAPISCPRWRSSCVLTTLTRCCCWRPTMTRTAPGRPVLPRPPN